MTFDVGLALQKIYRYVWRDGDRYFVCFGICGLEQPKN